MIAINDGMADGAPGYFNLGVNLRIENFLKGGICLNLRISNLLNQTIRYPTTTTNNSWADRGAVGHGRFLTLGIGWEF